MKLIVGLGNPGKEYEQTRHNAGFLFVDYLASVIARSEATKQSQFKFDKYSESEVLKGELDGKVVILAKPQTFMNDSGRAVSKLTSNNQLTTNNLIVVHDDLDLKLGEFKISSGKGPKVHNGILSIEEHLHTKDFVRVRIGVDNRSNENRIDGHTYVLQRFTEEEVKIVTSLFPQILANL